MIFHFYVSNKIHISCIMYSYEGLRPTCFGKRKFEGPKINDIETRASSISTKRIQNKQKKEEDKNTNLRDTNENLVNNSKYHSRTHCR